MALVFAVTHLYNILKNLLLVSLPFLYFKKKSGIDKLTELPTIPECPSLMCFFNSATLKGLILRFVLDVCMFCFK